MRAVTESSFIISETNHENFLNKNVDIESGTLKIERLESQII